jgi:hypothetical protein
MNTGKLKSGCPLYPASRRPWPLVRGSLECRPINCVLLRELAAQPPRFGYPRLHVLMRHEESVGNRSIHGSYRIEKLALRRRSSQGYQACDPFRYFWLRTSKKYWSGPWKSHNAPPIGAERLHASAEVMRAVARCSSILLPFLRPTFDASRSGSTPAHTVGGARAGWPATSSARRQTGMPRLLAESVDGCSFLRYFAPI